MLHTELTELFPTTSDLRSILDETSPIEPILVLLPSEGSGSYDMTVELDKLAKESLSNEESSLTVLREVAMGMSETDRATEIVLEAASKGHWVCLKNVHLVTSWLTSLDRLLEELARNIEHKEGGGLHPDFRLWMTAEPVASIPTSLLQRCTKIVSEVQ